jgi:phage terminase large subunit
MLDRTPQQKWPPDYKREMLARSARADISLESLESAAVGRAYYRTRPIEFIEQWCYTFDPRNAGAERPTKIPFILFPRQREFVEFLHACLRAETGGLIEKFYLNYRHDLRIKLPLCRLRASTPDTTS